jgi:CheY-like chemotaxis protein
MLRRSLGPTIAIEIDVGESLPPVRIDPHQLELALLNLALNARDAMPNGGRLSIRAYRDEGVGLTAGLPGSELVCAVVTDSGSGMDETTLKRATEPFFTTKGVGKGTGLGLPMVHGMVTQSGGAMQISSQAGQGTSVRLWLPVDRSGALPHSEAPEVLMQSAVSCRIMVVDDDPLILSSTSVMLEDLGHVVVEASSAASALEILRLDGQIDVVLTDYAMPAMTGADLAEIVRGQWPWMPVILASGYTDLQETENLPRHRLAKPFKQAELARCIASVIEDRKVVSIEAARRA